MPEVDAVAVLVATLAAFVLSSAYCVVLGDQVATVSDAAAAGDWLVKLLVVSVIVTVWP